MQRVGRCGLVYPRLRPGPPETCGKFPERFMSIAETKQRMRESARERRHEAASDPLTAGTRVAARFLDAFVDELGAAPPPVVSGYWPMRDEIDIRPLLGELSRRGVSCVMPVVVARGQPLVFRAWAPDDTLVPGPFGTSEPPEEAAEAPPDILLVPLLAFDLACGRLGYGAGYYDITLAALRRAGKAIAVGVAFDVQEVEATPMTEDDQRLDWVVTESRTIGRGD